MTEIVWIPLCEAIVVLIVTCALIYKYADLTRTDAFSWFLTLLSWYLSFSMIIFIPYDIYVVSASTVQADSPICSLQTRLKRQNNI